MGEIIHIDFDTSGMKGFRRGRNKTRQEVVDDCVKLTEDCRGLAAFCHALQLQLRDINRAAGFAINSLGGIVVPGADRLVNALESIHNLTKGWKDYDRGTEGRRVGGDQPEPDATVAD